MIIVFLYFEQLLFLRTPKLCTRHCWVYTHEVMIGTEHSPKSTLIKILVKFWDKYLHHPEDYQIIWLCYSTFKFGSPTKVIAFFQMISMRNHRRQLGEEICILGWWLRTIGVQSHKGPLIYLKSIHQFWGIFEVEGICKSKHEAPCFRQVWHTSDHGLSFYDNLNRVRLMAHVHFQWATAKLSVHLSFITTLLVETKKNQEFGQTNR